MTLFWMGDLAPARNHLEQAVHMYDPLLHRSHAYVYGLDPGIFSRTTEGIVSWLLGYPDHALDQSNQGLPLARELAHPFSLAHALHVSALVHQLRREPQLVVSREETVIALSAERDLSF